MEDGTKQKRINHWQVLARYIKKYGLKKGAEIGLKEGQDIWQTLKLFPEFHWIAVDNWHGRYKKYVKKWCQVYSRYLHNITFLGIDSHKACHAIEDKSLDIVFIDGNHDYEYVYADIKGWKPKVKSGGWLCGHDYAHKKFPGVKKAVDELITDVILEGDYVWLQRQR